MCMEAWQIVSRIGIIHCIIIISNLYSNNTAKRMTEVDLVTYQLIGLKYKATHSA